MRTLTKSGIDLRGFRVWKEEEWNDEDPPELVTTWWIDSEYVIQTVEGESWRKSRVRQLVKSAAQKGIALYLDEETDIERQEDIA